MLSPKNQKTRFDGLTLLEVCVAVTVSILLGAAIIGTLVHCMSFAASARLMTNARAIVHRNINAAAGVAFSSTGSIPPTLVPTAGAVICEDDGVTAPGIAVENIQLSGSANAVVVSGTLRRTVAKENVAETSNTQVYRITFQVDYRFLSRNFSYSETTLRSIDQNQ